MMVRKAKVLAWSLLLISLAAVLSSCGESSTPASPVGATSSGSSAEGTSPAQQEVIAPARNLVEVPFSDVIMGVDWAPDRFWNHPDEWRSELEIVSLALCAATQTSQETAQTVFSLLGFSDLKSWNYDDMTNIDKPAMTVGSRQISDGSSSKKLFAVAIRGTTSAGDLVTDVFSGKLNGSLKGPAEYEFNLLSEYIGNASDVALLITGHSLGGGTAQLLGQMCSDAYGMGNILVYTFAPLRTAEKIIDHTENICSVINTTDKVPTWIVSESPVGKEETFSGQDSRLDPYFKLVAGAGSSLPSGEIDSSPIPDGNHDVNLYMAYLMSSDDYDDWASRIRPLREPVGSFSIVGKWKSVGDYGFGQAQPGNIVIFDDTNCNFYSPQDTYRFYKSGLDGMIWLETTNVLWKDTLKFSVEVRSDEEITLSFGGQKTILQRVVEEPAAPNNSGESSNSGSFSIVGSWKSIGSYGFGQAQPGWIVTFDGSNCNFFSPFDTYALTQNGDCYVLETTSLLGQTLTFGVDVLSQNRVNIYYGDTVTELERVQ